MRPPGMKVFPVEPAGTVGHGSADVVFLFGVRVRGQGAGPGNVAMAGRIASVPAFGKRPARAGVDLAQAK